MHGPYGPFLMSTASTNLMIPSRDAEITSPVIAETVRWQRRTNLNPIRNLSAVSLTRALEAYDRGEPREAAMLWDTMASRDDTIPGVKAKREKSVSQRKYEITMLEKSAAAQAHKDVLAAFWENVRYESAWNRDDQGKLAKLIRSMQQSVSYGYSAHHIVWRPSRAGLRATFEHVPLWFFENRDGSLKFLPTGFGLDGVELEPRDWLISSGDALMVSASIGYFIKRATLQDWLRFSEKFAMPGVVGKTAAAQGTPQGNAMRDAVEAFGNEWAGVIYGADGSASIELIQANGNPAAMPMPALIDRVDRKIAALYRGADLSTMSSGASSDGVGASLQGEESDILERADAVDRSEELQRVERTVIAYHFGRGVEPLAQIEIQVPEREDQSTLLDAVRLFVGMGAKVPVRETMARFGMSETDDETEAFRVEPEQPPAGGMTAANAFPDEIADDLAAQIERALLGGLSDALADEALTETETE